MADAASTPDAGTPPRPTKKPRFRIELRAGIPEVIWWEGEKSHRRPDYEAYRLAMKGRYGLCLDECEAIKEIASRFREDQGLEAWPLGDFDTTKHDAEARAAPPPEAGILPDRYHIQPERAPPAEAPKWMGIMGPRMEDPALVADRVAAELTGAAGPREHVDAMLAVEYEHPAPIVEPPAEDEDLGWFTPQFRIAQDGQINLFDPDGPLEAGRKAKELRHASPSAGALAELVVSQIRIEAVEMGPGSDAFQLMYWDGAIYRPGADKIIASCVQTIMGQRCKKELVNETVSYIERMKHLLVRPVERSKVCVKNGILDLDTRELVPFRSDLVFTSMLPIVYDPDEDAFQIGKFLDDVLDPEAGTDPQGMKLDFHALMEYLGMALEPGYRCQKGAIFVGMGANGKSVLTQIITAFLGPENVGSVSMEELGGWNKYAAADLVGKKANICADISGKMIKDVSTLKKALGGDAIHAERKYGQPFSFNNEAKMFFSCNAIPESEDLSIAWTRRWLIFNFPRQFTGKDADPNIIRKLTTPRELSGLLNLALDGRDRWVQQRYFTGHDDVERDREIYLLRSDPSSAFLVRNTYTQFTEIEEAGQRSPIPEIPVTELYMSFVDWCTKERLTPPTQEKFSAKVQQVYPTVSKTRKWTGDRKKDGRYVYVWYGLGLV